MGLPKVTINQSNGALAGVLALDDGIAALVVTGPAPAGYTHGDQLVLNSLDDAEAEGFDSAYDTDNSVVVYEHIKDFFAYAGNGAELHFVCFADTVTIDTLVDRTEDYAKKLLKDKAGRINLLAVAVNPEAGYTPTFTNGIDANVEVAITNAQALAEEESGLQRPVQIIIEGRGFQGDPTAVADLRANAANRVSVALLAKPTVSALSEGTNYAAVGVVLGKLAGIPVQRNIGRRKDGPLAGSWGLSGNVSVDNLSDSGRDTLHDKGYIFAYNEPAAGGYVINDDPVCAPITDDYAFIARGRVMDKVQRIVYEVYVNELNDEVDINPENGRMEISTIKRFQALAQQQLDNIMSAGEEISGAFVSIDPTQDVITTNTIQVQVEIVPKGYAKAIVATLSYQNPNS
jgi:hypothetical protein